MLPILSLFLVLVLSMVVVRLGSVALRMTGMSDQGARFQARSAFTGAGFTTTESEQVVNHPLRRQIVSLLMVAGSVGITAASSTVILSLIGLEDDTDPRRVAVLALGIVTIACVASSQWIDRVMCGMISRTLGRYTKLETRDFGDLLHLGDDFHVAELMVEPEDWIVGQTIAGARLPDEGVLILGVTTTEGQYIGLPPKDFVIEAGQSVMLYGKADKVDEIDCRCKTTDGDTRS